MYEEPYRKKKSPARRPRRQKSRFLGWLVGFFLRLLALLLVLLVLAAGLLYALPVSLFAVEPDGVELSLTDGLPSNRANILLLGLDALRDNLRRSDSVVVASVGYDALKLTSVLRDTMVNIPGHGSGKLNAAYAYGGPELAMRTLNENLKLNIIHYLTVDYKTLVDAVDAMGGVDLDITEAEMNKINQMLASARPRLEARGYASPDLSRFGENTHLNGVQALAYARIRKLDSDFVRASRQRKLLGAMLKKLRSRLWNVPMLARLTRVILDSAQTNMSALQMLSLGLKALVAGTPDQLQLPTAGTYTDDGSSLRIDDLPANIGALQAFVYGDGNQ